MNRGAIAPIKSLFAGHLSVFAAVLGGGAATSGTVPSNGPLADDVATYPKAANLASTFTYVSTGVYDMVLTEQVKHILFVAGMVVDGGASPTAALQVTPTVITPSTKTIRVRVHTPTGTLTDLGTSDMLVLRIDVADTSSIG
jgi:hypothetical protein